KPEAETIVTDTLAQPGAETGLRLAYVRALTSLLRYPDAIAQLEAVTQAQPDLAPPFLSLGALDLEMKRPKRAEVALRRYLDLAQAAKPAAAASAASSAAQGDEEGANQSAQGITQAWLLLAQSAQDRGDYQAAEGWLARIDDPKRALEVQTRRASILARQGKLAEARALIQNAPEQGPDDARAKILAEAGVLRDVKHWADAYDVLGAGVKRFPDDTDMMYEQAMMAEKLDRMDAMEALLRRVMALKPDDAQSRNALGYSLADRGLRLPEARELIARALELAPGDPFITDSLGWVEYRLGHTEEALRLLRQAYGARPDPEIGAHLGEVLWSFGERDEARKVWTEARVHDADNDVLRETLTRLKVGL
ncbi:MAG: tetratricopeptide repeat protein, partial [Burkholderiales bacterium]|nr:tetratricopeptide repeat protein [Burkholderiales bacterium]